MPNKTVTTEIEPTEYYIVTEVYADGEPNFCCGNVTPAETQEQAIYKAVDGENYDLSAIVDQLNKGKLGLFKLTRQPVKAAVSLTIQPLFNTRRI